MLNVLFKVCFFIFLSHSIGVQAQDHHNRHSSLDIQHYKFELEIFDESDRMKGKATIRIKFLKAVNTFELDLVASNTEGKGMQVISLLEEGQKAKFSHQNEKLSISPNNAITKGETRTYIIKYEGIPTDGLIIANNQFGSRGFFGDNWPNRAHHWLPTVDHPSDKATVEFLVTAPLHFQIVANGTQIEESNLGDGKKLTHWKTDVVLPTKVIVIGAADFAVQRAGVHQNVPVTSWIFKEQKKEGFHDYAQAVSVLDFFTRNVSAYPYQKLANVQSKTRYGGMENASCIFYYEGSVKGDRSSEALIAHEIAHQWFGNSASEADWHHIWLSEGFATYWTHLYFEQMHGRDTFVNRLIDDREVVINYKKAFNAPVVDTSVKNYNKLLNANSYQKGGWVLHMLRQHIGDQVFFEGMRKYYQQYQFSNALTKDFQKIMEQVSGQNLVQFFQQWIFTAGHPKLKVSLKAHPKKKKKLILNIQQTQEGAIFKVPLEIGFYFLEKDPVYKTFELTQKEMNFTVKLPAQADEIIIDPNVKLLFEEIQNN